MTAKQITGFFWGVCLMTLAWMTFGEASVPENLETSIKGLRDYYIKEDPSLHNSQPVFLKIMNDLKVNPEESEKNLLMSIILDTYSRILSRMQNDTLDEATKERLEHVQKHLKKLQESYFPGKSAKLKTYAESLWAIEANDPLIQKKALFELIKVYREATNLRNLKNKERRRRQAKASRSKSLGRA